MKIFLSICSCVIALCYATNASASDCTTLEQKLANTTTTSITDETLLLRLSSTNGTNAPQEREISIKRKIFTNGTEKKMIKILSPADLSGVAILSLTSADDNITQWLYLPQTDQTKRILGSQKKAKFAGSEFTYEDLVPFDFKHYKCESILTIDATHLTAELKPQIPTDSYAKLIAKFTATDFLLQELQFLNAQNEILRQATFNDYRGATAEQKRPYQITMTSTEQNRQSTLEILQIHTNTNLTDAEFNMQALTR